MDDDVEKLYNRIEEIRSEIGKGEKEILKLKNYQLGAAHRTFPRLVCQQWLEPRNFESTVNPQLCVMVKAHIFGS